MQSNPILSSVIGINNCITTLNSRYKYNLTPAHLIALQIVLYYNSMQVNCTFAAIQLAMKLNGRYCNSNNMQRINTDLYNDGLLLRLLSGGNRLNLQVTLKGKLVLNDFERMLSNYKIKGLPG